MAKFKGTSAGEVYSGTSGTDKIDGRGGDDQLYGLGGDDKIKGGKGNDSLDGGDGKDKLKGGKGNDALHGGAGDDKLDGGKGDDFLDGGDDDDKLKGGKGDDTLLGGAGDDKLDGGKGDDFLDGGAGDDKLKAGKGDDEAAYTMAENAGASDDYRGGRGIDTLTLNLTAAEWFQADVQSDIADYLQFLAAHINPGSGEADSDEFQFSAFDLEVREFENLRVIVDGNEIDPTDQGVDAVDDSVGIFEGDSATVFPSVLANDDVPDLAYSVELVSGLGAGEGTLVFNAGSPGAPDGSFSYDPGLDFEYLAFGETHDVSFTYKVTDADGDVDTATVTITVTGTNDAPVITSGAGDASGTAVEAGNLDNGTPVPGTPVVGGTLTSSDADITGTTATWSGDASGTYGDFAINPATGAWTYSLNNALPATDALAEGQVETETFTSTVTDDQGATATQAVTVTVNGTNDSPVANDDTLTSGSPGWTYNPANGHYYRVVDDGVRISDAIAGASALGGYLVTITSASEQAFIEANGLIASTDGTWTGGQSLNPTNLASWTWTDGPEAGQAFTYSNWNPGEPNGGFVVPAYAQLLQSGKWNDAPDATLPGNGLLDGYLVERDGPVNPGFDEDTVATISTADLLANDTDVDTGAVLTVTGVSATSAAGAPVSLSGTDITYDPRVVFNHLAEGDTATDTFTYTVIDEFGATDTATVTLTVQGANDAPVAVADFATATAGGALLADLDALAVNDTQGAGGTFFTQLLSNDGSGNFTDTLAGGAAVRSSDVALGDLDGDGDLDAVISVFGNNIAPVLINQGGTQGGTEGTFTVSNVALPQLSFGNPGNTGFGVNFGLDVELGDVDGDGDLDALLANWNNQSNVLLTNDGSGNFTTSLLAGGIKSWSRDIRLADVDADGDLDALVSTDNNINQLYTNQGGTQGGTQGIFVASNLPSVLNQLGSLSIGIDTGDVNGDGHLDVLITNILDQNEILLGDGTGTFTPGVLAGGNRQSTSIRLGDLDGDGDLDAFVSNVSNQLNQVLINQGGTQGGAEGTFVASDVGTVGRNSQSVALVDVDQDGDLDAVVGNNSFNTAAVPDQTNQVYLNDGFGGFTATTLAGGNNPTNSVEFGDLDGDGATPATNAQGLPNLPLGGGTPAGPVTGSVATNDSDVDNGAILSFALDAPVAGLTLDADGSYSFDASDPAYSTIPSGDVVDVVANYTVTDEYGASAQSTLTISVTGTGTPGPTGALKLVAYVDTDLDHDYTEGVDAMIAGLYDSNASGVIDVGDELWLDAFPLDLDDTTTGEYSGKGPHAITNVINGAPVGYGIRVTVDSGDEFYFNKIGAGGAVGASTEAMSGGGSYFVDFNFGRDTWQHGDFNFMDRIVVSDANATTQADQAVPDTLTTDYFNAHLYALNRDGSFFDIDIF